MNMEHINAYELIKEEGIGELNSQAYILEHKKSGARIFLLSNDDENKVFTVGFRTPPADSTGVPHILEHSVLCGSRKFPAKDPFVELVKGSLNTFLNAMTYPDKTVYPVASCNDQDFHNLMDVYMDAVLHPNIYANPKIFLQEGWHYELESEDSPLTVNGVVYNEMKGAFSSPESILERYISSALYPDTPYAFESGGDPDVIPTLTYEQFLQFHETYYHPSNSYIYLYGDMDMEKTLNWLDDAYLKEYDRKEISSEIACQKPFGESREETIFYPITDEENEEAGTYLSLSVVTGTDLDPLLYVAFQILDYALLGAPGAPLKQALLDAGIGSDIFGGYDNGILQPYFSVIAKGARLEQKDQFLQVIADKLAQMAKEGISRKSLQAGINYFEFKYREADYGRYPKGLMYGLQCFDSWLYDEKDPLMHLKYEKTFETLKEKLEEGYFEELLCRYLIENPHRAVITVVPKKGLLAEKEAKLAEKLQAYKDSLTGDEIRRLAAQTKELKEYQEEPSTQEELEMIPMLSRGDIKKEAAPLYNQAHQVEDITVLHHSLFTAGIGYLRLLFNTQGMTEEDLLYVGLLKSVLGFVDTEHFTYQELFDEIHIHSGGLHTGVVTFSRPDAETGLSEGDFTGHFEFRMKALYEKLDFSFSIIEEILLSSKLEDEKRLQEIIAQLKSRSQMSLQSAGHQAAVLRGFSYFSQAGCYGELTGGIRFYHFVEDLDQHFQEKKGEIIANLKRVKDLLFVRENLLVSYTADEKGYQALPDRLTAFARKLCGRGTGKKGYEFVPEKKNEGFKCSSQVQYVAVCGNFKKAGFPFHGAMKILKVILDYDYLWIHLRVKGGAYGCMSGMSRNGEGYLVSYRDPNLGKTLAVYEKLPEYVEQFDVDEREMTKYIIGTVSNMDTPLSPSDKGARSLSAWMAGISFETLQRERDQVLGAQPEQIRALAPAVRAILEAHAVCVVGNDGRIEEEKELFGEVKNLFH